MHVHMHFYLFIKMYKYIFFSLILHFLIWVLQNIYRKKSRRQRFRPYVNPFDFGLFAAPVQFFFVHSPDVRLEVALERERVRAEGTQKMFPLFRRPGIGEEIFFKRPAWSGQIPKTPTKL